MSEKDIRKQINYCKNEITRLNKEYKDKKYSSKKEIQNKFYPKINEIKSKIRALTKNDDKEVVGSPKKKEKKQLMKSLKREIRAI